MHYRAHLYVLPFSRYENWQIFVPPVTWRQMRKKKTEHAFRRSDRFRKGPDLEISQNLKFRRLPAVRKFLVRITRKIFNFSAGRQENVFWHEYCTKFYITRCENVDFRTRSVRKTAFTHSEWYKRFFITPPWFRPVFMPVERDYNRVFRKVWVQTSL